jgi:hypothetical protein
MFNLRIIRVLAFISCAFFVSGCWHGMLFFRSIFNSPDKLVLLAEKFPDGNVGSAYDFQTEIVKPGFQLGSAGCSIQSGQFPPGLKLESGNDVAEGPRPIIRFKGIPTKAGLYEFELLCGCCMTMPGMGSHGENEFQILIH